MLILNHIEKLKTKTSVAIGCFDGVHLGHMKILSAAKLQNLPLCVLCFDSSIKNIHPIYPKEKKIEILKSLGVDILIMPPFQKIKNFSGKEFVEKILKEKLNASVVTCGRNFCFGKNSDFKSEDLVSLCSNFQIKTNIVGLKKIGFTTISSTKIRQLISDGNIHMATKLLGRPFSFAVTLSGTIKNFLVFSGDFSENEVVPSFGVFKGRFVSGAKEFPCKAFFETKNGKTIAKALLRETFAEKVGENGTVFLDS